MVSSANCGCNYVVCGLIAGGFVASMYVWKRNKNEASTHPSVIKRRFASVLSVSFLSPFVVNQFVDRRLLENHSLLSILGLRTEGLIQAAVIPLFLTSILFLGPLLMQYYSGFWRIYIQPMYWYTAMTQVINIRNYVVAPISEEFVFRACMIPLIMDCTAPLSVIFICPLFFGAGHLHHMLEQIRLGVPWKNALIVSCFQFLYTSLFGAYSAYLFLRTGHLIAPVIVHSFCNHMGFPDFGSIFHLRQPEKSMTIAAFGGGLIIWIYLLTTLTEPSLYSNNLPWASQF